MIVRLKSNIGVNCIHVYFIYSYHFGYCRGNIYPHLWLLLLIYLSSCIATTDYGTNFRKNKTSLSIVVFLSLYFMFFSFPSYLGEIFDFQSSCFKWLMGIFSNFRNIENDPNYSEWWLDMLGTGPKWFSIILNFLKPTFMHGEKYGQNNFYY